MDHLPSFGYMTEPYPRVPYLCNDEYDGLPFALYHERRGWGIQRLYNADFSQHERNATASFLQSWLFFGSLNEIFGYQKPFNTEQFVLEDSEGKRVCTSSLNNHIAVWAARMEKLATESAEDCRAALTRTGVCLNTIHQICKSLSIAPDSPLPSEVTLSFAILGCTIDHALQWYWGLGRGRNWDLNATAAVKMLQTGWCPRDIAVANATVTEMPMFCTSYMSRPSSPNAHWNCTQSTCELNQIDEEAYVVKHRKPGCQCAHLQPSQADLCKILDKGEIPVISLTPKHQSDGTRSFNIAVKPGGVMIHSFVAISHVWSDGLGNPRQNSLPLCQVGHIYDLLVDTVWDEYFDEIENPEGNAYENETEKKILDSIDQTAKRIIPGLKRIVVPVRKFRKKPLSIWIDTFCVPLETRYRKKAIAQMQEVYAKAAVTAVFDSELQTLKAQRCTQQEILTRVGLSGWFRRAWTFQEGVLANTRLRILFAEGLSKLPLGPIDDKSTVELQYIFPRFASSIQAFEEKVAKYADRHGVERPALTKVPQSRLAEIAERKKNFSLEKYMLDDVNKYFIGMKTAWRLGSGWIKPSDQVHRITSAWEALRWRATSREDDKFICFATTCVNRHRDRARTLELLSQPPDQRMKLWIQQQDVVPAGFLFLAGPKYDDHGFRWVPKAVWREPLEDTSFAERETGSRELLFRKSGFLLSDMESVDDSFQISDDKTSLRYSVTLIRKDGTVNVTATAPLQKQGNLAIVLMQMIGQRQPEFDTYKEPGALLMNLRRDGKKLYGDFLCRVEVGLLSKSTDDVTIFPARQVADDQVWVIS